MAGRALGRIGAEGHPALKDAKASTDQTPRLPYSWQRNYAPSAAVATAALELMAASTGQPICRSTRGWTRRQV